MPYPGCCNYVLQWFSYVHTTVGLICKPYHSFLMYARCQEGNNRCQEGVTRCQEGVTRYQEFVNRCQEGFTRCQEDVTMC